MMLGTELNGLAAHFSSFVLSDVSENRTADRGKTARTCIHSNYWNLQCAENPRKPGKGWKQQRYRVFRVKLSAVASGQAQRMFFQVVGCMITGTAPSSIGDSQVVTEKKAVIISLLNIGFNSPPPKGSDSSHIKVPPLQTFKAISASHPQMPVATVELRVGIIWPTEGIYFRLRLIAPDSVNSIDFKLISTDLKRSPAQAGHLSSKHSPSSIQSIHFFLDCPLLEGKMPDILIIPVWMSCLNVTAGWMSWASWLAGSLLAASLHLLWGEYLTTIMFLSLVVSSFFFSQNAPRQWQESHWLQQGQDLALQVHKSFLDSCWCLLGKG